MRADQSVEGGRGEKSGGVKGAGMWASRSRWEESRGAWMMLWWWLGRFAEMDVKDCEKEKTCRPSMWVKNSGKKRSSF